MDRARLGRQVQTHQLSSSGGDERRLAGEHLVEHTRERVDIGSGVDVLATDLFGTHVLRRTEDRAHAGGQLSGRARVRVDQRPRNPEIGDQREAIGEQDVLRFDVTMNDTVLVRVRQRACDLARETHRVLEGELSLAFEARSQRFPRDVRHDVKHDVVRTT